MKFRATLELAGKTATSLRIPPEVIVALGQGARLAYGADDGVYIIDTATRQREGALGMWVAGS